jgi:predicted nucleic acid-binding protein
MILLDTNVISEMMKTACSTAVMNWIDQQESTQLFITTITIAEIMYGLNALPEGSRRNKLEDSFNMAIMDAFQHRILDFDELAARIYGKIMAQRKNMGRPLSIPDGQIAAIAHVHGSRGATRNIRDFADCGLNLINPFEV